MSRAVNIHEDELVYTFLAPTGAQEMLSFSRALDLYLSGSYLQEIREQSERNQKTLREQSLKTETYSRSLKYCVLLHFNFRWTNPDSRNGLSERKKMIRAEKKSFELVRKEITLTNTKKRSPNKLF